MTVYNIPPIGTLVNLGSHTLHAYQLGEGNPTVIFEAGLGAFALQWGNIQPQIAQYTRTLSYDRAGYGWSDPSPLPRTPQQFTQDLHQLLDVLHIAPPYILVSHSFGGLISRYFAHQYPAEVKGLVLVDVSHEMQLTKIESYDRDHKMMLRALRLTSLAAHIPFIGRAFATQGLQAFRPYVSDETWQQAVYLASLPKYLDTMRLEMTNFSDFFGQTNIIPRDFGDLPLIVITAAESILHERPRGNMTAEALNQAHQQMQAELSRMSTKGQHITIPGATHLSIIANPAHTQYVIDAIQGMLSPT